MNHSDYQKTIDWLFQQFPSYQLIGSKAYKPTLENVNRLLHLFAHPEKDLRFIHVAGSNGKGSVCSLIASTLTEANLKVGLFTSPHIKDFSERIRINGNTINQEFVSDFVQRVKKMELDFEPSFFEITFVMALDYFKESKCDICVIETGLGGRLDATNAITPLLSIITSISLEHTQLLGNSIAEIAAEKGGIIKQGVPVVLGNLNSKSKTVITEMAKDKQSEIAERNIKLPQEIKEKLIAEYQRENVITAFTAIQQLFPSISIEHLIGGFNHLRQNTGFYGRLEIIRRNPLIIYDVSHNADGIRATLDAIQKMNKGQLHLIYGTSSDKDLSAILHELPSDACYYLTEFGNLRSASIDQLKEAFFQNDFKSVCYFNSPEKALQKAKKNATMNDTILVMGSFFLVEHFF